MFIVYLDYIEIDFYNTSFLCDLIALPVAPCVAIQKGCNVLPDKCFFVKYVKGYRCFADLLGKSQTLFGDVVCTCLHSKEASEACFSLSCETHQI